VTKPEKVKCCTLHCSSLVFWKKLDPHSAQMQKHITLCSTQSGGRESLHKDTDSFIVCVQDNQSGGNRESCCLGVWAELLESVKVTEYVFHCLATWYIT